MVRKPTSVRWDEEKLNFVKEKEKLDSVQKVFTFLLDKYWWEHKIGTSIPTNNSYITGEEKIKIEKELCMIDHKDVDTKDKKTKEKGNMPDPKDKAAYLKWLREN